IEHFTNNIVAISFLENSIIPSYSHNSSCCPLKKRLLRCFSPILWISTIVTSRTYAVKGEISSFSRRVGVSLAVRLRGTGNGEQGVTEA
ncbi:MAG: hypothetical protein WA865_12700, partial [Spirulinaceae cyanobacterium]